MASSAKQSKPFPKVLSSISFHIAHQPSGGAVFVKVMVFIAMLAAEVASEVRRVGDDNADMIILPECHPNPLPLESGRSCECMLPLSERALASAVPRCFQIIF